MKERIKQIMQDKSFTAAEFAEKIGVQKSGISHILSGRNNPSLDFAQKILLRFTDVNTEWLILGNGEPYKNRQTHYADNKESINYKNELKPPKDLFSSPQVNENDKNLNLGGMKTENNKDEKQKNTNLPLSASNHLNYPLPPLTNMPESGKKIIKVMIFYDNKTFVEFVPE